MVCKFLELGQFGSLNSKAVSEGCAWALRGEHSLKVACSAHAVQGFPLPLVFSVCKCVLRNVASCIGILVVVVQPNWELPSELGNTFRVLGSWGRNLNGIVRREQMW